MSDLQPESASSLYDHPINLLKEPEACVARPVADVQKISSITTSGVYFATINRFLAILR